MAFVLHRRMKNGKYVDKCKTFFLFKNFLYKIFDF